MKLIPFFLFFYLLTTNICLSKEVGFIILNNGKKISCSKLVNINNKNLKFTIDKEEQEWTIGESDYDIAQLNQAPEQLTEVRKLISAQKNTAALKILNEIESKFFNLGWNSDILRLKAEIYFQNKDFNQAFLQLNKILMIPKKNIIDKNLGENLLFIQQKFWNYKKYESAKLASQMLIKSGELNCRVVGYYTLADYYQIIKNYNLASKNYMYAFIIADCNKISETTYSSCIIKLILQLRRENKDFSQYVKILKNYALRIRDEKNYINTFIKEITKTKIETGLQKR